MTLGDLTQTFDGQPKPASATTDPEGLAVAITYDGDSTPPTDAGSYPVEAVVTATNYTGSASGTLVISPAAAAVTLGDLAQTFDGDPKPASATTDPEGLAVTITYDGDTTPPTDAGSYPVEAVVTATNYSGSASGTLVVVGSYLSWIESFFTTVQDASFDSDGDGWSNLAEYLFDTDPSLSSSAPSVTLTSTESAIDLHLSPAIVTRPDAIVGAETSTDLNVWSTEGVSATASGFSVPNAGFRRFLKLVFIQTP